MRKENWDVDGGILANLKTLGEGRPGLLDNSGGGRNRTGNDLTVIESNQILRIEFWLS